MAAPPPMAPGPMGRIMDQVEVEIRMGCRSLKNKDLTSKSDPFAVLFVDSSKRGAGSPEWREFGRTETIQDNLNPKFQKGFSLPYRFEETQRLKVEVYDSDSKSSKLSEHDSLGVVCVELGVVMGNCGRLTCPLFAKEKEAIAECPNMGTAKMPRQTCGGVEFSIEEINTQVNAVMNFKVKGEKLDKKDFLGKSDPYFEIYRFSADGATTNKVHTSEVIKSTLNPIWRPFRMDMRELCNGDMDRKIRLDVWDWDKHSSHDLIGHVVTTAAQLTEPSTRLEVINEEKAKKKGKKYKNSGELIFQNEHLKIPVFAEYICAGFEVSLVVAIDFTGSNGDPRTPKSLHYNMAGQGNCYTHAISTVGNILAPYDRDKMFPVYGFGANVPGRGVSHCFACNFNEAQPEVYGTEGILGAYQNAINQVGLSGPTYFAPLISNTAKKIHGDRNKYTVLLIITDGEIMDMQKTIDAIVDASALPLSIIIVGVGTSCDFKKMDELDGDDGSLKHSNGRVAQRDIVQFVPMKKFANSYADLAAETLREVPGQFQKWAFENRIPKPVPAPIPVNVPPPGAPPPAGAPPPISAAGDTL